MEVVSVLGKMRFAPGEGMAGRTQEQSLWRAGLLVASVGLEMAVAVAVGYFVGDWVDKKIGTEPWAMLIFLGCGIAAAFRSLWRTAKRLWPRDTEG